MCFLCYVYFLRNESDFKIGRDLIEDESAEENRVKSEIYLYYAQSIGLPLACLSVAFYALFQTFTVGANLWLSVWSEDEEAATNTSKRNMYLGVYGTLGVLQVLLRTTIQTTTISFIAYSLKCMQLHLLKRPLENGNLFVST